jgi:hypothetical protein
MTTRETLYHLIDDLPDSELYAVQRFLEYVRDSRDPLTRLLDHAPPDDEPLTQEDIAALDAAHATAAQGQVIPHEQLRRELGW